MDGMNRLILVSCVAGALVSCATGPAGKPGTTAPAEAGHISRAKEAEIRRLVEVSGAKSLITQMMGEMATSLRPMLANSLPPGAYRERLVNLFFEKFQSKSDPQSIVDMAVPVYDKYLTEEEVKGLIRFYSSPLGRKSVEVVPQMMAEMSQQGRVLGEKLGRDSMMEVLTEHPDLKVELEEAVKRAKGK
jgi:hypothetical protein